MYEFINRNLPKKQEVFKLPPTTIDRAHNDQLV